MRRSDRSNLPALPPLPLVLLLLSLQGEAVLTSSSPLVARTAQGAVRGRQLVSYDGRRFSAFQGIPYAKPPVGELRLQDPEEPEPWEGVLAAVEDASMCTQNNIFIRAKSVVGSEDCLYLNVYSPQQRQDGALLPVMVWIHGGGWISGAGTSQLYSPLFLVDRDVVLVTFNYRLGPLGFLSTGDAACPGNFGLKDQLAALRWVQTNIAAFGGDAAQVTVCGESAGGASVHYLMMSPLSRGLFHRAISQSGLAVNPWATPRPDSASLARKVASLVGCPEKPSAALVECLRRVPAHELVATDKHFMQWDVDPLIPFRPVVDGHVVPVHPLQHDQPFSVPWMTGVTRHEGALRAAAVWGDERLRAEFTGDFDRVAPLTLFYEDAPRKQEITSRIRDLYFPGGNFSKEAVVDLYSDAFFMCNYDAYLRQVKDRDTVFYYEVTFKASRSFSAFYGTTDEDFGVCHGDELLSLFPAEFLFPLGARTPRDVAFMRRLTKLWANFARTGNPTPDDDDDDELLSLRWPKVQSSSLECLELGETLQLRRGGSTPAARARLWSSLPVPCASLHDTTHSKEEL